MSVSLPSMPCLAFCSARFSSRRRLSSANSSDSRTRARVTADAGRRVTCWAVGVTTDRLPSCEDGRGG